MCHDHWVSLVTTMRSTSLHFTYLLTYLKLWVAVQVTTCRGMGIVWWPHYRPHSLLNRRDAWRVYMRVRRLLSTVTADGNDDVSMSLHSDWLGKWFFATQYIISNNECLSHVDLSSRPKSVDEYSLTKVLDSVTSSRTYCLYCNAVNVRRIVSPGLLRIDLGSFTATFT